ncbi:MAG: bifunctional 5,10-methylenetetrahydrofolate dehydrogenase/5,10-methenyltetrahydrofolate cyclohydrolase [Thermoplasmata archaeon]|nr:bifunctional 5,10-methylenetetrahydrofolate dehydrogenase/5,10-methenyltetrahydrofolate cyclohydrolase [Thermoplasmata archaeon]
MTTILDGKPVAEMLLADCRRRVELSTSRGERPPGLVSLHLAQPTPFSLYLKRQAQTAAVAGVTFRSEGLNPDGGARGLRETVATLERDESVDGVLLEHPLPVPLDFSGAVGMLSARKDVDGVNSESLGRLASGHPAHAPAVALGAIALARFHGIGLKGRRVAVIGRSPTVGTPLALLLLARGLGNDATVTVVHSATPDLSAALSGSEVVFSCAGHPGLLTRATVPKDAAVIDVGLSTIPDPSRSTGVRAVGDADAASLEGWASALTPVPGGVGPVTVAQLMHNVVDGWESGRPPQ